MTTYFISDLHLEESRPDITEAFLRFLREDATQARALYILGDLFEVWIGDDNHTPLNNQITSSLKTLTESGVPVFVMHGNRDFLLGAEFAKQTGSQIINDPTIIDFYGKPALLMHGDTLCTDDVQYIQFRRQVRNPLFQQDFLSKSLAERDAFAKQVRNASKAEGQNKAYDIMDVTPQAVIDVMTRHNVDLLIHGHTHRPAMHTLTINNKPAERIVLGDWDKNPQIIRANAEGYSLLPYSLK